MITATAFIVDQHEIPENSQDSFIRSIQRDQSQWPFRTFSRGLPEARERASS